MLPTFACDADDSAALFINDNVDVDVDVNVDVDVDFDVAEVKIALRRLQRRHLK